MGSCAIHLHPERWALSVCVFYKYLYVDASCVPNSRISSGHIKCVCDIYVIYSHTMCVCDINIIM